MTYEEFASDLPLHGTIAFTSVEENEETFRRHGVNQEMRQLGKGKYRSDFAVRDTEHAALFADRYSKACLMYLEPPAGTVGLIVFRSANERFLASGASVANDKLVVVPDGSGTDLVTSDLAGSEAFAVPEARFIEMAEVLCPTYVRPEGMAVIEGNTAQLHALRKGVLDLIAHPELDPHGDQVSSLVEQTIAWMGHSSRQWRPENFTVNGARRRVAKLAQEFIEEDYYKSIRLEDLCRVTGVGVRTLQRAFREYFDLTITDYLKAVRLDASRRELAAAHPPEESVSVIALRHGFTHFGRFSGEFRRRFGELPKETLAMRAGRKS